MKLHDFYTECVDALTDEDFNAIYWGTYAILGITGLLLACTLFPPLLAVGAALIFAQPIAYGLAWAFVGLVGLADLIFSPNQLEQKALDATEGKSERAEYFSEPAFNNDSDAPVPGIAMTADRAAYANPISAQTYVGLDSDGHDFSNGPVVTA